MTNSHVFNLILQSIIHLSLVKYKNIINKYLVAFVCALLLNTLHIVINHGIVHPLNPGSNQKLLRKKVTYNL